MKKLLLYLSTIGFALNCHATVGEFMHSALLALGLKPKQQVPLSESLLKYSGTIGEYYDPETFEVIVPQTWSEYFDKLTLGDARRTVFAGIASGYNTVTTTASDAAQWTSDTACLAAANASYVHSNFIVPAWKNSCAATSETWFATKDFGGLVKDTGYSVGKFVYNHPQVTLAVGVVAALYYFSRAASGVVEQQWNIMQDFVDNTIAEVTQFNTSNDNIAAKKAALFSACDVSSALSFMNQNEIDIINDFYEQVRTLNLYLQPQQRNNVLIASQVTKVQKGARLIQFILSKKMNLHAAQRSICKK